MKTTARLLLAMVACVVLSSCWVTTAGLTGTVCYDQVCVSATIPPKPGQAPAQAAPALPTVPTPWPAPHPQRMLVKDAGK